MILAAQFNQPDQVIGVLAVLLLSLYGLVKLIRWVSSGPVQPDPWSDDVAAKIASDDSLPVCHRCLAPHDPLVHFCPDCGAPVGTYTNWLPYPYLFSVGDLLRMGTEGNLRRSPLVIAGFVLFGLVEYTAFAPVYWYRFLKNLWRQPRPGLPSEPLSPESGSEDPSPPQG